MNKNSHLIVILLFCAVIDNYAITSTLATMISPTSGGTIGNSGSYYLDWDVTGTITINAPNVTLNLNNHAISGTMVVNENLQNIKINNGIISAPSSSDGITISRGCDIISIANIDIENAKRGINMTGSSASPITNISLDNVQVTNSVSHGYFLTECSGEVVNCVAYNNGGSGFNCAGLTSILVIKNSESRQSGANGIHFFTIEGGLFYCTNLIITENVGDGITADRGNSLVCDNCYFNNNQGAGLRSSGANVTASYCTSAHNGDWGFYLSGNVFILTTQIVVMNSLAQHNASGGFFMGSTDQISPVVAIIKDSASVFNTGPGFDSILFQDDGTQFSVVWCSSNYAVGNAGPSNYYLGGQPLGNGAFPYAWQFMNNTTISRWYNVTSP